MIKNLLRISAVMMVAMLAAMVSCNKEATETPQFVEDFVDRSVFEMQARGNCGRFGCYEFVFPITIEFADATTAEVASYEELRSAIKAWIEANPEATQRPTFQFPIEVLSEDGEVISVANQSELNQLRMSCRRDFFERHGHRGHMERGMHCFSLVFPVTIIFPDQTEAVANGDAELKQLLRGWKAENRGSMARPELAFPLQVRMEDETVVTVQSKEELHELKSSCGAG